MDIISYFLNMINPFRHMSAQTIRAIYAVCAFLTFIVCTVRVFDVTSREHRSSMMVLHWY
jgi:hypothetical protein